MQYLPREKTGRGSFKPAAQLVDSDAVNNTLDTFKVLGRKRPVRSYLYGLTRDHRQIPGKQLLKASVSLFNICYFFKLAMCNYALPVGQVLHIVYLETHAWIFPHELDFHALTCVAVNKFTVVRITDGHHVSNPVSME